MKSKEEATSPARALIVDLHINSLRPEGHFYERAVSLAHFFKENLAVVTSLCCSLELIEQPSSSFESVISQPGYNSFGFPVMAASTKRLVSDFVWIDLAEDYLNCSNLVTGMPAMSGTDWQSSSENDSIVFNLSWRSNLTQYLKVNLRRLYCAAPRETVCIAQLVVKHYRPRLLNPIVSLSSDKIKEFVSIVEALKFKDENESSALHRAASARIAAMALSEAYDSVIFATASPQDAIGALAAQVQGISRLSQDRRRASILSFVFHQPTDFADKATCYNLLRLYHEVNSLCAGITVKFYASCEELKSYVSAPAFCGIGNMFKVLCGPFPQKKLTHRAPPSLQLKEIKKTFKGIALAQKALSSDDSWNSEIHKHSAIRPFEHDESRPHIAVTVRQPKALSLVSELQLLVKKAADNMLISYLGDIRDEKEFHNYLLLSTNLKVKHPNLTVARPSFFSSGGIEKSRYALCKYLSAPASANDIVYDLLEEGDYFWLMQNSSCVYAAYSPRAYAVKQSGIFFECLLNATPTIISVGTSSSHALGMLAYRILIEHIGEYQVNYGHGGSRGQVPCSCAIDTLLEAGASGLAVSILAPDMNNFATLKDVHIFFRVDLMLGSRLSGKRIVAASKYLEFRGSNVACVFSRKEIEWLLCFNESDSLEISIVPVLGASNEYEWRWTLDVMPAGSSNDIDFFACHAIIDLDDECNLICEYLKLFAHVWWSEDRDGKVASEQTAAKIRSAIERDLYSLMEL